MSGAGWMLDAALVALLAATLFHAVRLERALGVLKRDRAQLEGLIEGFNASTRQAENGIRRLQDAAEGAGRQVARRVEQAAGLKDDLLFLSERGEKVADRLDALLRGARARERDQVPAELAAPQPAPPPQPAGPPQAEAEEPRLRSQAERDLQRALRGAR